MFVSKLNKTMISDKTIIKMQRWKAIDVLRQKGINFKSENFMRYLNEEVSKKKTNGDVEDELMINDQRKPICTVCGGQRSCNQNDGNL